jgi:hypothetical protein
MRFNFPYTERQKLVMESPAQILWIGAGTKTGKSAALFCWLIQGLLKGEACCFCGPWFFRSRRAFDEIKNLLEPFIAGRIVRVNEARLQLTAAGGGYLDFTSADNPHNVFGGNYNRVVLDEASRMPSDIYAAALTTISATNGKVRAAFNVELGQKNWAIANLLRVQKLSPENRARSGEDFLTFPSGGDGLVSPALIELMRSQMPEILWRALYLGEVPTSDCSLFRNLDKIFTGQELEGPISGVHYFLAADVARKKDWSVLTVIDEHGRVAAMDRFHQISWTLQVERAALWYRTFHCSKVIVDATGVGDVVAEEFEKAGMVVQAFMFTVPSRRLLVEELVLACDNGEIILPATEKFKVYRTEMESMEFVLDGTSIRYAVPSGSHDDALFSLALATHVYRASRGAVLGLLALLKRKAKEISEGIRDTFGELVHKPAPKLVAVAQKPAAAKPVVVDNFAVWLKTNKAPACPACGNTSTTYNAARKIFCNQCHAVNGELPQTATICDCGNFLPQFVAGVTRCGNCGWQSAAPAVAGMSRDRYAATRSGFGNGRFGRFG